MCFQLKIVLILLLAHDETLPFSRSFRSLKNCIDDDKLLSVDEDERTYLSISSDNVNNTCPTDFLILIFYGGM